MLKIYTSTVKYSGKKEKLDITVKTGFGLGKKFAPTWEMVEALKSLKITEEKFTEQYYDLMRKIYLNNDFFECLLNKNEIVLCCYCPKDTFCHRYLLVDMLIKIGGCQYYGEI